MNAARGIFTVFLSLSVGKVSMTLIRFLHLVGIIYERHQIKNISIRFPLGRQFWKL